MFLILTVAGFLFLMFLLVGAWKSACWVVRKGLYDTPENYAPLREAKVQQATHYFGYRPHSSNR